MLESNSPPGPAAEAGCIWTISFIYLLAKFRTAPRGAVASVRDACNGEDTSKKKKNIYNHQVLEGKAREAQVTQNTGGEHGAGWGTHRDRPQTRRWMRLASPRTVSRWFRTPGSCRAWQSRGRSGCYLPCSAVFTEGEFHPSPRESLQLDSEQHH